MRMVIVTMVAMKEGDFGILDARILISMPLGMEDDGDSVMIRFEG